MTAPQPPIPDERLASLGRRATDSQTPSIEARLEQLEHTVAAIRESLPKSSEDVHKDEHERLLAERAAQEAKDAEAKAFRKEIRSEVLKLVLKGLATGVLAALSISIYSEFKLLVNQAIDTPRASLESKR